MADTVKTPRSLARIEAHLAGILRVMNSLTPEQQKSLLEALNLLDNENCWWATREAQTLLRNWLRLYMPKGSIGRLSPKSRKEAIK